MSIIEEYAEETIIQRIEDNSESNEQPIARISFGTFVLRVPVSSDN